MTDINKATDELERLLTYSEADRVVTNREAYAELIKNKKDAKSFKSGISRLDDLTGGFEAGEVWVVSGIQKHGKTTLCDTITYNMGKNGIPALWFYFEGNMKYFLEKYQTEDMPTFYVPLQKMANNIGWIGERVAEAQMKYNCQVVVIDHLHYVADFAKMMKNQSLEIGQVMRYLVTEIAIKLNVCVFLVCHVTKTKVSEKLADESDLRDSSFIAQEASGVITVQRALAADKNPDDDNPFTNEAQVMVCNARRSGVMRERLRVIKVGHFFKDIEPGYNDDVQRENEEMRRTWKD